MRGGVLRYGTDGVVLAYGIVPSLSQECHSSCCRGRSIYLRKDDAHDSNRGNRGVDGPCISSKTCGCDSLESTVRLTIVGL